MLAMKSEVLAARAESARLQKVEARASAAEARVADLEVSGATAVPLVFVPREVQEVIQTISYSTELAPGERARYLEGRVDVSQLQPQGTLLRVCEPVRDVAAPCANLAAYIICATVFMQLGSV